MIVTKQWLNQFIDISNISTETICKTLNNIGLEVDSEKIFETPKGVVLGKVLDCIKHPDADKLSVCQVDIGSEILQIVCGAKNVTRDQFVPVATIGTDFGDGFVIKKSKLRGAESNGMICSSTELGLPKMNDGILVLDDSIGELVLGKAISEFGVLNDTVIEIELTANRGDCLNIVGIARELSVAFGIPLKELPAYKDNGYKYTIGQFFDIKTSKKQFCDLAFVAANIENLKLPVSASLKCAIIEKYSNTQIDMLKAYAEHCVGAIFDAFPADAFDKINSRYEAKVTQNANGFDAMLGGANELAVIGVDSKKFDDYGTQVLFQASYQNPENLAKMVFETKQKTGEAYYKSSRGSNPDVSGAIKFFRNFAKACGADLFGGSEEFCEEKHHLVIDANVDKLNAIIGQEIPKHDIERILNALGFGVREHQNNVLTLKVPLFRHDIKNIADVAEEIVRIVGIDNIKSKPLVFEEINRKNKTSDFYELKNQIRQKAIGAGFFETITYVFSERNLLTKYGFEIVDEELDLANPITNELNTFRSTMFLNLIQAVAHNSKFGYKKIPFFEIGRVFDAKRNETTKLAFVFCGQKESEKVENNSKPQNIDLFGFAQKVSDSVGTFELSAMSEITNKFIHPYQNGDIYQNGCKIGYLAKLHPAVQKEFDIDETYICEIDFDKLANNEICATNVSKFQSLKRDLSVLVPKNLEFHKIRTTIDELNINELKSFNLADVYSDEKLGDFESLTLRFTLQSDEKTLEDDEIIAIMAKITNALADININIR